ncbi:carbohydrate esterase family 16 protein [Botrytis cinerea T4]|uniref:Carbohydrate esterase family 16 protein n=1 Tax=Botryotinia fuckeliana (strain T4) TaxID=999810 RepID=G2XT75_BOTF4|nr:carbohydrate esterase family 16 protein [Botrytis cinerea T4]
MLPQYLLVVPLLVDSCIAFPFLNSFLPRQATGTKYLFSFGDSYTRTLFSITGTKPSADNPIGNPPFPGTTTDAGLNWIDYLVTAYNTSLTLSYNFAVGGSTVDDNVVPSITNGAKSLVEQTAIFTANLAPKPSYAPWTSANTLFAVWFGINDIDLSYAYSNESELFKEIFDTYWKQLDIMYYYGGRNFALLTVPPTNKTPRVLGYNSTAQAAYPSSIAAWNTLVKNTAAEFQSERSGTTVKVIDTSVPFNTALSNPTAYGSPNAVCYNTNGVSCLWWNSFHPGQAVQKLVAAAFAGAYSGTFF